MCSVHSGGGGGCKWHVLRAFPFIPQSGGGGGVKVLSRLFHPPLWQLKYKGISLGGIQNAPTQWVLALFAGFPNIWFVAPNFRSVGGGGGMCMPFQISMGWGGGKWSHF